MKVLRHSIRFNREATKESPSVIFVDTMLLRYTILMVLPDTVRLPDSVVVSESVILRQSVIISSKARCFSVAPETILFAVSVSLQ